MNPLHHSKSSVAKWGGKVSDYMPIHRWFDESKKGLAFVTHRAIRHHSEGIGWCENVFGNVLILSNGKEIPVRYVAEQHIKEDCNFIPTMKDWLQHLKPQPWMYKVGKIDTPE